MKTDTKKQGQKVIEVIYHGEGQISDISNELRRTYVFPGGEKVVIEKPVFLVVSKNGHRVADGNGNGHYIPMGWIHLCWENKPGAPAISF